MGERVHDGREAKLPQCDLPAQRPGAGGAVYPGAYAAADSLCGRPQPPIPDSASVYTVNDKCGSGGSLGMWADSVRAHEKKHEASLNSCITSGTAPVDMEYRYLGAWKKHSLILGGHSGTVGC